LAAKHLRPCSPFPSSSAVPGTRERYCRPDPAPPGAISACRVRPAA